MKCCKTVIGALLLGALSLGPITGCEDLPGSPGAQGAVIGGVGGAAAGAAIAKDNRVLGALLGGALGAGGGYLIGANIDKIKGDDEEGAREAVQKAQDNPAQAEDVYNSTTADLNDDGFVTMDEVVAMEQAGLTDNQILDRMQATGHIFELTPEQEQYLRNNGVSSYVLNELPNINAQARQQIINERGDVISRTPAS